MSKSLQKIVPALVLASFGGLAFAGAPSVTMSQPGAYKNTVIQADPTPEYCKNNPTDPRCKDK